MNKNIWAPKRASASACCKIPYKGYEISIAMDDSCGGLPDYSRSSLAVFRDWDGKNVTKQFFGIDEVNGATAKDLKKAFSKIDMYGDRD